MANMFKDELDIFTEEFEKLLETYDFEDLLEQNDLTPARALAILFLEGFIEPPETKPVN